MITRLIQLQRDLKVQRNEKELPEDLNKELVILGLYKVCIYKFCGCIHPGHFKSFKFQSSFNHHQFVHPVLLHYFPRWNCWNMFGNFLDFLVHNFSCSSMFH